MDIPDRREGIGNVPPYGERVLLTTSGYCRVVHGTMEVGKQMISRLYDKMNRDYLPKERV